MMLSNGAARREAPASRARRAAHDRRDPAGTTLAGAHDDARIRAARHRSALLDVVQEALELAAGLRLVGELHAVAELAAGAPQLAPRPRSRSASVARCSVMGGA
jgi:hypothetical protein